MQRIVFRISTKIFSVSLHHQLKYITRFSPHQQWLNLRVEVFQGLSHKLKSLTYSETNGNVFSTIVTYHNLQHHLVFRMIVTYHNLQRHPVFGMIFCVVWCNTNHLSFMHHLTTLHIFFVLLSCHITSQLYIYVCMKVSLSWNSDVWLERGPPLPSAHKT